MPTKRITLSIALLVLVTLLAGTAVWPRRAPAAASSVQGREQVFWSFKPVAMPPLAVVNDEHWVRNPIDRFVLSHLEAKKLHPAPEADKTTLIRRASFDLTGLPPTPQEIRAFLADASADAYEKVVDRLLASPHYGERWGRHWLDVARYVPGRITFPGIKHTAGDQPYRDYVVRALNNDKPYDQFLTEQLAGDLLPPSADRQQELDQITAPAFLSIGAWFDQETDPNRLRLEMIDDQINVTSKAFLGLSVACARCHDHKFDPIPTTDYYALGGIFASTRLVGDFSDYWRDGRVRQLRPLAMPDEVAANAAIRAQIEAKKAERWNFLSQQCDLLLSQWKLHETEYRTAAASLPKVWVHHFEAENFDGEHNLRIAQLSKDGQGSDVIETLSPIDQWVKYKIDAPQDGTYRLEAYYSSDDQTPISVQVNGKTVEDKALTHPTGGWELKYQRWDTVATFEMRAGLNFIRLLAKAGNFPRLDRFRIYRVDGNLDAAIDAAAATHHLHPILLADFLKSPQQPWPAPAGIEPYLGPEERRHSEDLSGEMERLESAIKPYELTIAVSDQQRCTDLPVHIRGGTDSVAPITTPRGVPHLLDLALPRPTISPTHSGRLELARWLTNPANPLTSRVMVNRIWQHHFGRGIVATPSDFGTRGEPPTHPELLDWLAATFVEDHWSMKQMHRLIMTSSAYRMSAAADEATLAVDPDGRELTHFPPHRLEAEALYDAMLCTINTLVKQEPGEPLDVKKSSNRALYVLTSGRSPPGMGTEVRKMLTLFDYDFSGAPLEQRPTSITASQSLFWLNSPVVKYFAGRFAERLLKMDKLTDRKRVEMAYLLALGHSPDAEATRQAMEFLAKCQKEQGMTPQDAWAQFCQALYASGEFHCVE